MSWPTWLSQNRQQKNDVGSVLLFRVVGVHTDKLRAGEKCPMVAETCVWGIIRGKMSGGKMCRGICPGGNVLYTPELVKVVFMQKWLRRPTLLLFSSIFGRSYCCTQCDRLLAWCRPSVRPSIRPSVCDEMFCGLKPKKTLWQTKKNKNWKLFTKKPVFTVLLPIVLLHAMWSSFCDEVFCGLKRKKN